MVGQRGSAKTTRTEVSVHRVARPLIRWSYGELTRLLDGDIMVFWIANQYLSRNGWNLYKLGPTLTRGVVNRVTTGG